MKKRFLIPAILLILLFSGCFEVVQETTVKANGSGIFTTQLDMSALMEMLGQMGGAGDEKIEADTSILFSTMLDSVQGLTPEEKTLLKDATAHIQASTTSNKLVIAISAPFTKIEEIDKIKTALGKVDAVGKAMDQMMENEEEDEDLKSMTGGGDLKVAFVDNYYTTTTAKGLFKRSLIKEKYDSLANDEFMQKMKEGMDQGMPPVKSITVFNLPTPVKKAEGKNVELSADKKKITIENTMDELFDDPASFEFTVEY